MPDYALLISSRAAAAYFANAQSVVMAEAAGVAGATDLRFDQIGDLVFLRLSADASVLPDLLRLSAVQGAFEMDGSMMRPLDHGANFALHPDFVWGEKYRGKTNETLTQLMINVGLQQMPLSDPAKLRLLDPMCGRGTTLLWAMRYGLHAVGIEQDDTVLSDVRRGLKKWTKIHRQKHKLSEGWTQKANKKGIGKFLEFSALGTAMRLIVGDSAQSYDLTQRKPFDLIVTDVPYGVQHMGGKDTRSPLETLKTCAPVWAQCLAPGGAMVVAFNSNIPKRSQLIAAFGGLELEVLDTKFEHRMSESIVRDVLVMRKAA